LPLGPTSTTPSPGVLFALIVPLAVEPDAPTANAAANAPTATAAATPIVSRLLAL
jgi:hypothetical protein